jgi:hypothetical protein
MQFPQLGQKRSPGPEQFLLSSVLGASVQAGSEGGVEVSSPGKASGAGDESRFSSGVLVRSSDACLGEDVPLSVLINLCL